MIIDGKEIADKIFSELAPRVAKLSRAPRLVALTCDPQFETKKFIAIKKKKAESIGIVVDVIELPKTSTTEDCLEALAGIVSSSDGIILQLPFPPHLDIEKLLKAIPSTHDVDAFTHKDLEVLPPVVGAMATILDHYSVSVEGKQVLVIGSGRLVGKPAAEWFSLKKASVIVVTKETGEIEKEMKRADIIVSGAGVPNLLMANMVKEGVVILDAGTSEDSGELRGDANPSCALKASLFTPVPGGIGPITIAVLLRNLVFLAEREQNTVL